MVEVSIGRWNRSGDRIAPPDEGVASQPRSPTLHRGGIRDLNERRAELRVQKESLVQQLADLEDQVHQTPNPDLLGRLPVTSVDLDRIPDELSRRLFEALRLQIHYDGVTNEARCRVTLTGDTIDAVARTTREAAVIPLPQDAADRTKSDRRVQTRMNTCPQRDSVSICTMAVALRASGS